MSYGYRGFKPMEHHSFITWFQHYFPSIYSVCGYLCGAGALELQIGHWLPLLHTGILVPKAKPEEPPPSLSHRTFFKTSSKRMSFFFLSEIITWFRNPRGICDIFSPSPLNSFLYLMPHHNLPVGKKLEGGKVRRFQNALSLPSHDMHHGLLF